MDNKKSPPCGGRNLNLTWKPAFVYYDFVNRRCRGGRNYSVSIPTFFLPRVRA
jgi:hypothetical protein